MSGTTGDEPIFRVWGWEERPPCGRVAYVYHMALEYLLAHGIPIPPRLAKTLSDSLVEWELVLKATNPAFVAAHVTGNTLPEVTDEAYGRFVLDGDLPPEVELDVDDQAAIAALRDSPATWDDLSPRREAALSLRLAIAFVRTANGEVLEGVVRQLLRTLAPASNGQSAKG